MLCFSFYCCFLFFYTSFSEDFFKDKFAYKNVNSLCSKFPKLFEVDKKFQDIKLINETYATVFSCCSKAVQSEKEDCIEDLVHWADASLTLFGAFSNPLRYQSMDYFCECGYYNKIPNLPNNLRNDSHSRVKIFMKNEKLEKCCKSSGKLRTKCYNDTYFLALKSSLEYSCNGYSVAFKKSLAESNINEYKWQYFKDIDNNIQNECSSRAFGNDFFKFSSLAAYLVNYNAYGLSDEIYNYVWQHINYTCSEFANKSNGGINNCIRINPLITVFNLRKKSTYKNIIVNCCSSKDYQERLDCFTDNHIVSNFGMMTTRYFRNLMTATKSKSTNVYREWECVTRKFTDHGYTWDYEELKDKHFQGFPNSREFQSRLNANEKLMPHTIFWFLNPLFFDQDKFQVIALEACKRGEVMANEAGILFPDIGCQILAKAEYIDMYYVEMKDNRAVDSPKYKHKVFRYFVARDCCIRRSLQLYKSYSSKSNSCAQINFDENVLIPAYEF